jgi:hypothetical protein
VSTVFLLSPAYCAGRRAALMLRPESQSAIARQLRAGSLTLGDAFAFMSGLYFRGKITYARAFDEQFVRTFVITPTRGLLPPHALVDADLLREFAAVDISEGDHRYRAPLERDLRLLVGRLPPNSRVVLLGSVATGKYVNVLVELLGNRLYFPPSFIGRGDMSRGGLLLRQAAAGAELEYERLEPTSRRRGPRPPKLDPRTRVVPVSNR